MGRAVKRKSPSFGRVLFPLLLLLLSACSSCAGLTTNVAQTSFEHENERLRTRVYDMDVEIVREIVRGIVQGRARWKLTGEYRCCERAGQFGEATNTWPRWKDGEHPSEVGAFTVEITTLVFRFVDDMTVFFRPTGDSETTVDVLSASRVGKGDLGVNARNVARFLETLDEAVRSARPVKKAIPEES